MGMFSISLKKQVKNVCERRVNKAEASTLPDKC